MPVFPRRKGKDYTAWEERGWEESGKVNEIIFSGLNLISRSCSPRAGFEAYPTDVVANITLLPEGIKLAVTA